MADKEKIKKWLTEDKKITESWFHDNGLPDFIVDIISDYIVEHKLEASVGVDANLKNDNCAIFDVNNLTIIGLLKLMNEYNKKHSLNIGVGFYADGVGDICDYSSDVEICISDFKTLNEAIQFLSVGANEH